MFTSRKLLFLASLVAFAITGGALPAAPAVADPPASQASDSGALLDDIAFRTATRELGGLSERLEAALASDDISIASRAYILESLVTRALARQGSTGVGRWRALLTRVLRVQERLQQHAHQRLEAAFPGEPENDVWSRNGIALYRPLYRSGLGATQRPRTAIERRAALAQLTAALPPSRSHIERLERRALERLRSNELFEWVQVGRDFFFSTTGAKHPVIARGRSVRSAGSGRIVRNASGNVVAALISNTSGNYKAGLVSIEAFAQHLIHLGVSPEAVLQTTTLPGEPINVRLLHKAAGILSREQIQDSVSELVTAAARNDLTTEGSDSLTRRVRARDTRSRGLRRLRQDPRLRLPRTGRGSFQSGPR